MGFLLNNILSDFRFGVRTLLKHRLLTALTILCLGLGTGANLTIFGLINAVLLRPVSGVTNEGKLVRIGRSENGSGFDSHSYANYIDIRSQNKVFADVAAFHNTPLSISGPGFSERIRGSVVSANHFDLLGVSPSRGRFFLASEGERATADSVVVLSHDLWVRRFGSDPAVIGKSVTINSNEVTVIGIADKAFKGLDMGERVDIWLPISAHAQAIPASGALLEGRDDNWLMLVARLKPGVGSERAQAEMDVLAATLRQAYPSENATKGLRVARNIGMDADDREEASGFLGLIMIVALLVLLIACANVANLLLVRSAARRREIAIRRTLGASRGRIVAQLLTESVIFAVLGSAAGLFVALWSRGYLTSLFAQAISPDALDFSPDIRVLGFTLLLTLFTMLVGGLAPALHASKPDLIPDLKDARGGRGNRRGRLSDLFIVAQVGLSLLLLIGAGLLIRTMQRAQTIDPGFESDRMLLMTVDLELQGYDETRGRTLFSELEERVGALAGVRGFAIARALPVSGGSYGRTVFLPWQTDDPLSRPPSVDMNLISAGYLETMGMRLAAGRDFDKEAGPMAGTVLINEAMARRFWPGQSAMGKRFEMGAPGGRKSVEVIGITNDSKHRSLNEAPRALMYVAYDQEYAGRMVLHVRTSIEPTAIRQAVEDEIRRLDPGLPVFEVKTMNAHLRDSLWPQRASTALLGTLGLLALTLTTAGVYGVVSFSVAERVREIGIRRALGAQNSDVIRVILGRGMSRVLLGTGLGLVAAFMLTPLLRSLVIDLGGSDPFFGVSASDSLTFTVVPVVLCLIALVACFVPAHIATRIDPGMALRRE